MVGKSVWLGGPLVRACVSRAIAAIALARSVMRFASSPVFPSTTPVSPMLHQKLSGAVTFLCSSD